MKICVIHVNCEELSEAYTRVISANFDRVKRADTEIVHKYVAHLRRATDTVFAFPILLNKIDVVQRIVEAEAEGADGVMVACSGDPGVAEGRTLVDFPVVGPMEAALHLAATYGKKIGIVTTADPSWSEYCATIAENCGLGGRIAGVERIAIPSAKAFTEGFETPGPVREAIILAARKLIADGANTIVLGSAGLSVMASATDLAEVPGTGVPVFDVLSAGLKMTELKIDLQRAFALPPASRIGMYERLDDADRGRIARLFDLPWAPPRQAR
ncbi:aspartate/glutamate racemase family protein [Allorhizobium pseudoryzae]|jgi:allantoin racemase|uniref:aspartate/glutamate racemase family protein n=1 Tax=Allorhizobium pseudoryzae TaxID=379684 RepID=UPI003CFE8452